MPLGLIMPTTISTTSTGILAVVARFPDGGVQLAIKYPKDAVETVSREKVAVTRSHEMRMPEYHFKTVVKTVAKNMSVGNSARALAKRYSNGVQRRRVCSR